MTLFFAEYMKAFALLELYFLKLNIVIFLEIVIKLFRHIFIDYLLHD